MNESSNMLRIIAILLVSLTTALAAFVPRRAALLPPRLAATVASEVGCPFSGGIELPGYAPAPVQEEYAKALDNVDWDEVKSDLKTLFKDSKEWWPADYGHYGGLFIRLAWHCTGSYRMSDGRGGCDGGAQRFDPVRVISAEKGRNTVLI